jgi:hypothetical protein
MSVSGEDFIEEILIEAHELGIFSRTIEIANSLSYTNPRMDRSDCFLMALSRAKKEREINEIYRKGHTGHGTSGKNG